MFSLSGIGIVLPLENKMKNPKAMSGLCGILSTGTMFVCALYIITGFFGYLVFGDVMKTSGSITLNLPKDELYVWKTYFVLLRSNISNTLLYFPVFQVGQLGEACFVRGNSVDQSPSILHCNYHRFPSHRSSHSQEAPSLGGVLAQICHHLSML